MIGILRLPYIDKNLDEASGLNKPIISDAANTSPQEQSPDSIQRQDAEPTHPDPQEGGESDQNIDLRPSTETKDTLSISFAGDTMAAGRIAPVLQEHGYMYPWKEAKPFLEETDLAMVNLETAVSTNDGEPAEKEFAFLSHPDLLKGASWAGVDLVSLANNHALDYGEAAFLDTLQHLEEHDLDYVGGGVNAAEAYQRKDKIVNGKKISFLGFSRVLPSISWYAGENKPGLASGYQEEEVYKRIAEASEEADIVVVYMHWGKEMTDEPQEKDKQMAYRMIDAGADAVIGAHPHVLQGMEFYKGKLIAYSLGNFIFTMSHNELGRQTAILQWSIDSTGKQRAKMIPMVIEFGTVRKADEETSKKILERLTRLSKSGHWDGDVFEARE